MALSHVEPLKSLEQKISPRHTCLIVVDVQNDFCAEGGMMHSEGLDVSYAQAMAERLPSVIESARRAGVLVVFVQNVYSTPANWYLSDVWLEQAERRRKGSYVDREVCAPGSWNMDFYGEVRPLMDEPIVHKHRFSAFLRTDLETILRSHGIRTVVMTGVATNVCVETTAREAFLRDYYVVMTTDGTATYSVDEHEAALRTIDRYFGELATCEEIVEQWDDLAKVTAPDSPTGRARARDHG